MLASDYYGREDPDTKIYRHYPSFLRLFRYEIESIVKSRSFVAEYYNKLTEYLPDDCLDMFNDVVNINESEFSKQQRLYFFKALCYIADEKYKFWKWFHAELITYFKNNNNERLLHMLKNAPEFEKENFDIFFVKINLPNQLDYVVDCLMVEPFIKEMREMRVSVYDNILHDYVEPRFRIKGQEFQYTTCELLRCLFYCKPGVVLEKEHSWYKDFIYMCTKDVRNVTMLDNIDNQYHVKLDEYITYLNTDTNKTIFDNEACIDLSYIPEFRPPSIDIMMSRSKIDPESESNVLKLRDYQVELAKFANDGINTVICAPTGAGKTIVAINIMENHLLRRNYTEIGVQENSRILFIVPTVPLVEQQRKLIHSYLGDRFVVNGFFGGDKREMNKRAYDILNSHIVVSTPQMIVNLMESVSKDRHIYITDFTLYVLDECHHCMSKHPYEIMMRKVRNFIDDPKNPKRKHPQVVGLTASLGTNQGNTTEQVEQHIYKLCVNMNATQISTVRNRDSLAELQNFVNPPVDQIYRVKPPKVNLFRSAICEIIQKIVDMIKPSIEIVKETITSLKDIKFPKPTDPNLRINLQRIYDSRQEWPEELEATKLLFIKAYKRLKIYLFAIELNEMLPAVFAHNYIIENLSSDIENNGQFGKIYNEVNEKMNLKELANLEKKSTDDNKEKNAKQLAENKKQILEKLQEILETQYKNKPDTRAMVFVKTRSMAQHLSDYLNRCACIKPFAGEDGLSRYLTSSNQSRKYGGVSSAESEAFIRAFGLGRIKILVVTSIAEEGIDISACNLIIKYNNVGSERTMIQRRGRARSLDSKSVLICLDGEVEQREIQNVQREQLLHQCLMNLQAKSGSQLEAEILKAKKEHDEKERQIKEETERRCKLFSTKCYDLLCHECNEFVCRSEFMRSMVTESHFCCVDPRIWQYINIARTDSPSSDEYFIQCGRIVCKKCNNSLGSVIRYADVYLPSLRHSSIKARLNYDKQHSVLNPEIVGPFKWTQWEARYFNIPSIGINNLLEMAPTFQNTVSKDEYEQVKYDATFAIQHKIEKIKAKKARKLRFKLMENELD